MSLLFRNPGTGVFTGLPNEMRINGFAYAPKVLSGKYADSLSSGYAKSTSGVFEADGSMAVNLTSEGSVAFATGGTIENYNVYLYIGAATWAAGIATLAIHVGLGQTFDFLAGQKITVTGVGNSGYDVTGAIISSVDQDNQTISYSVPVDPGGDSIGGQVAVTIGAQGLNPDDIIDCQFFSTLAARLAGTPELYGQMHINDIGKPVKTMDSKIECKISFSFEGIFNEV